MNVRWLWIFFMERFLVTDSYSLVGIRLFRYSFSSVSVFIIYVFQWFFLFVLFQLSQCFSVLFSLLFPEGSFLDFFFPSHHCPREILMPSVQFSSVAKSCPTLCDPMNRSTPGLPVHHQLPEFTQTHVHQVSGAIQPSHPLSSPSAPNPSQHQSLFQWVNSSHEVAKVLEFQL